MSHLPGIDLDYDPLGTKETVSAVNKDQNYKSEGLNLSNYPKIEGELYDWVCAQKFPKKRDDVRKKAMEFAFTNKDTEFQATLAWFNGFLKRFGISSNKKVSVLGSAPKVKGRTARMMKLSTNSLPTKISPSSESKISKPAALDDLCEVIPIVLKDVEKETNGVSEFPKENGSSKFPMVKIETNIDLLLKDKTKTKETDPKTNGDVKNVDIEEVINLDSDTDTDTQVESEKVKSEPSVVESESFSLPDLDKPKESSECSQEPKESSEDLEGPKESSQDSEGPKETSEVSKEPKEEASEDSNVSDNESSNEEEESDSSDDEDSEPEIEDDAIKLVIENFPEFTKQERKYYKTNYSNFRQRISDKVVRCTACCDQINHTITTEVFMHPVLHVLICKKCVKFYGRGIFKKDSEGYDEYCRWCANGGDLLLCDSCQNGFCKMCVKRNLGRIAEAAAVKSDTWTCYVCDKSPLIDHKLLLRYILERIFQRNQKMKNSSRKDRGRLRRKQKFVALRSSRKAKGMAVDTKPSKNDTEEADSLSQLGSILDEAVDKVLAIREKSKSKPKEERSSHINKWLLRLTGVIKENLSTFEQSISLVTKEDSELTVIFNGDSKEIGEGDEVQDSDVKMEQSPKVSVDDSTSEDDESSNVKKKRRKKRKRSSGDEGVCPTNKRKNAKTNLDESGDEEIASKKMDKEDNVKSSGDEDTPFNIKKNKEDNVESSGDEETPASKMDEEDNVISSDHEETCSKKDKEETMDVSEDDEICHASKKKNSKKNLNDSEDDEAGDTNKRKSKGDVEDSEDDEADDTDKRKAKENVEDSSEDETVPAHKKKNVKKNLADSFEKEEFSKKKDKEDKIDSSEDDEDCHATKKKKTKKNLADSDEEQASTRKTKDTDNMNGSEDDEICPTSKRNNKKDKLDDSENEEADPGNKRRNKKDNVDNSEETRPDNKRKDKKVNVDDSDEEETGPPSKKDKETVDESEEEADLPSKRKDRKVNADDSDEEETGPPSKKKDKETVDESEEEADLPSKRKDKENVDDSEEENRDAEESNYMDVYDKSEKENTSNEISLSEEDLDKDSSKGHSSSSLEMENGVSCEDNPALEDSTASVDLFGDQDTFKDSGDEKEKMKVEKGHKKSPKRKSSGNSKEEDSDKEEVCSVSNDEETKDGDKMKKSKSQKKKDYKTDTKDENEQSEDESSNEENTSNKTTRKSSKDDVENDEDDSDKELPTKKENKKEIAENERAKLSLLRSDSDSDEEQKLDTKKPKKGQKSSKKGTSKKGSKSTTEKGKNSSPRKYTPKPKSKKEEIEKCQLSSAAVEVNCLSEEICLELEENGFVDVNDYPYLMDSPNDSEDELEDILKFKAIKKTKKHSDQNGDDNEDDGDDEDDGDNEDDGDDDDGNPKTDEAESDKEIKSKKRQKKSKKGKDNEGLMDIDLEDEDENEEEEEVEEPVKTSFIKVKKSDNNELLKDALVASSDEEVGNSKMDTDDDISSGEDEKKRKRYEKKKEKLKKEEKESEEENPEEEKEEEDKEDDEEEEVVKKSFRKGYATFNFSSDESEVDSGPNTSPFKPRLFQDSESDFEVSTKKAKKSGLFEDSTDSEDEDSSDTKKKEKNKKTKRIKRLPSSSDEEQPVKEDTPSKKKLRRILADEELLQSTKDATQEEEERRERLKDRQSQYNKLFEIDVEKDQMDLKHLVLDFDEKTKKPLVEVNEKLLSYLKPHQVKGIKFMWDTTIESLERLEKGEVGGGCILAHCMGLGKTLQVITFIHTLLRNTKVSKNISRILVCCPVNTVLNWKDEIKKWLKNIKRDFDVFELVTAKDLNNRAYRLDDWFKEGGVCIIGYDMFRNLSNPNSKKFKERVKDIFQKSLVSPGPDVIVCDEGHILKNEKTALSIAINKVKTLRRIVLTGTPLQNNLKEYHCMIQFVKPNLLGSRKEFMNRFVNPIEAGQCIDAVPRDVRRMKRRAHILHNMLEGCVQRFDYSVLKPFLPPKFEYVVSIQLTEVQIKLYDYYLNNLAQGGPQRKSSGLFVDFNNLMRIWSHPAVLYQAWQRHELDEDLSEETDEDADLTDFIDDGSDSSSSEGRSKKKKKTKKKPKNSKEDAENSNETEEENEETEEAPVVPDAQMPGLTSEGKVRYDWWRKVLIDMCPDDSYEDHSFLNRIEIGGKMYVLIDILRECSAIGDKVLVFSQSVMALNMIEAFLGLLDSGEVEFPRSEGEDDDLSSKRSWKLKKDYLRLDGSTSAEQRKSDCTTFNNTKNERCRLFLISTRAGGVGINLVGANRVIIFDSSWNPSHDTQSIFRIYRFGQKKPCYIYRFVAQGTMEEKIYSRQVTKISTSLRVVDEHQIKRYFKTNELSELYEFTPADPDVRETPVVPDDRLLAELLIRDKKHIVKFHEQDSLLENQTGEELTEEERKAAWEDYENEKKGYAVAGPKGGMLPVDLATPISKFNIEQIMGSIKALNPRITNQELMESTRIAVNQIMAAHMTQLKNTTIYLYNLKNPMLAPEVLRQLQMTDRNQTLAILDARVKILEMNVNEENQVLQRLNRVNFQQRNPHPQPMVTMQPWSYQQPHQYKERQSTSTATSSGSMSTTTNDAFKIKLPLSKPHGATDNDTNSRTSKKTKTDEVVTLE